MLRFKAFSLQQTLAVLVLMSGYAIAADKEDWSKVYGTTDVGDTRVTLRGGLFQQVDLVKPGGGEAKSQDELFVVLLVIENRSDTKKLDYKGWGTRYGLNFKAARVEDEYGNNYHPVTFGLDKINGQSRTGESIYPEKSLTEVLVFELPTDKAKEFRFELPAEVIGGKGTLRLRAIRVEGQKGVAPARSPEEIAAIVKERDAKAQKEREIEERAKAQKAAEMAKKAEEDKKAAAALLISQGKADAEWAVFQKRLDSAKSWDDSMKKTADGIDKKYPGTKRPEKTELEIDAYPKLRLALQVHRSNTDVGRKRLNEIIKDFPGTLAARQAEKTIGK